MNERSDPLDSGQLALKTLKRLHGKALELVPDLKFDGDFDKDGLVVCYYARLVELTGGMLAAMDKEIVSAAEVLFRSFLESYVDFCNSNERPDYLFYLAVKYDDHWKKIITTAKNGNEFFASIAKANNIEERLRQHTENLEWAKKEGFTSLSVKERFVMAGLEKEYSSIYLWCCTETHGDLQAMKKHHMEHSGDQWELLLYRGVVSGSFLPNAIMATNALFKATEKIHARLGSNVEARLKPLKDEWTGVTELIKGQA